MKLTINDILVFNVIINSDSDFPCDSIINGFNSNNTIEYTDVVARVLIDKLVRNSCFGANVNVKGFKTFSIDVRNGVDQNSEYATSIDEGTLLQKILDEMTKVLHEETKRKLKGRLANLSSELSINTSALLDVLIDKIDEISADEVGY
jgi:hypothetical protein